MIIKRTLEAYLDKVMGQFPIVTLTGPRQSGKTTLVKTKYPNKPYFNLEDPDFRQSLMADPRQFLAAHPKGAILDEIQHFPEFLSYLQQVADNTEDTGLFILTGSHQLLLHESVTQSLAGRSALLDLYPLTLQELSQDDSLENYLFQGFYPAIYSKSVPPTELYRQYIRTYVERDVRQVINIQNLTSFQTCLKLLSGRIGSLLNIESLSNDIGIAHNTVKRWISLLQASYLVYQLQPYYENFGKRLIKSPKLYFSDVGLVSYLLEFDDPTQITHDRLRGALFENFIVMELLKLKVHQGKEARLYYYRDNHGHEIDIIIKHRDYLIPIEIKSTMTFNNALLKQHHFFKKLVKDRMPFGFLVYAGELEQQIGDIHLINFKQIHQIYELIETNL